MEVRSSQLVIVRVIADESGGDLLGRRAQDEATFHLAPNSLFLDGFVRLGPARAVPRRLRLARRWYRRRRPDAPLRAKAGQHGRRLDALLAQVVTLLAEDKPLPAANRDPPLSGEWNDCRDCHLRPDLLLLYRKTDAESAPARRRGQRSPPEIEPSGRRWSRRRCLISPKHHRATTSPGWGRSRRS